jgi:NADH-quinone oxidoreductase subunit A
MALLFSKYLSLFIFIIVSSIIALIFFLASYCVAIQKPDTEKLSAYECGFDPFNDARNTFDVRFYLVAILFIIFDLEVTFLFPWCITIGNISIFSFWSVIIFLIILTVGFLYEWRKGALEWE